MEVGSVEWADWLTGELRDSCTFFFLQLRKMERKTEELIHSLDGFDVLVIIAVVVLLLIVFAKAFYTGAAREDFPFKM